VGGLGEAFVSEASRRGVRRFTLIDHDRVRRKNLARAIWYRPEHAGLPKVEALARELRARDARAEVTPLVTRSLTSRARSALGQADLVVAAVDNNFSRYHLQAALLEAGLPLLDLGAQEELEGGRFAGGFGQVRLALPGGACLVCMGLPTANLVDPVEAGRRRRAGYLTGTTFTPRRVRSANAHIALAAVDVMSDWALGLDPPRYLFWDGVRRAFRHIEHRDRRADCPLCRVRRTDAGTEGLAALRRELAT
jgi:hypothetical protein